MDKNRHTKSGFSMVEVMVAMTISVFILASSYATVISLSKGTKSMINFSEMNSQTRNALELFGRDTRMARYISKSEAHTLRVRRQVEGVWVDVEYKYNPTADTLDRSVYETNGTLLESRTLLFQVDELELSYYNLGQDPESHAPDVYHIELEAKLERKVLSISNTNYIISARFMMRNKHVNDTF